VQLLDEPAWASDPALRDPLERSRRGDEINAHVRAWMARHGADEVVRRAQEVGVPVAKYRTPTDVIRGEHERARGLFAPVTLADGREAEVLLAPMQFRATPLALSGGVPGLGAQHRAGSPR
jgi:crotonobetainyl-CoA:carnitine CoA-transferase CaiB-like acyl-CoA transferase